MGAFEEATAAYKVIGRLDYPISNLEINMSTKRSAEDEKVTAKKAKLDENAASKLVEEYDEEDVEEEEVLDGEDEEEYGDEEEDLDDEEEEDGEDVEEEDEDQ